MRRAFAVFCAAAAPACMAIADFDDFAADCPSDRAECARPGSGGEAGDGGAPATGGAESGGRDAGTGGAPSSGGTASNGGAEGGGKGGAPSCEGRSSPGHHGPEMARVRRPDGTSFWIDRTEVTVGQYAEYIAAGATPHGILCALPGELGPFDCESAPLPADAATPRTCVDWCEAQGFCAWAGKRLCADLPSVAAASAPRERLLVESEFFAACSPGEGAVYGCGEECDPRLCNGASAGKDAIAPVNAFPLCCVPDACGAACAIADLGGNVAEWTDGCSDTTTDADCVVRGGDYETPDEYLGCSGVVALPRRARNPTVGFRCCAEAE